MPSESHNVPTGKGRWQSAQHAVFMHGRLRGNLRDGAGITPRITLMACSRLVTGKLVILARLRIRRANAMTGPSATPMKVLVMVRSFMRYVSSALGLRPSVEDNFPAVRLSSAYVHHSSRSTEAPYSHGNVYGEPFQRQTLGNTARRSHRRLGLAGHVVHRVLTWFAPFDVAPTCLTVRPHWRRGNHSADSCHARKLTHSKPSLKPEVPLC